MIDEVLRLRKLRKGALTLRALGRAFSAHGAFEPDRASLPVTLLSWRVARIATGQLRAHPHHPFRRDPGVAERAMRALQVLFTALHCRSRLRRERLFLEEFAAFKHLIDDVRSLTRSAELSDSLGRAQSQACALLRDWRRMVDRDAARTGLANQAAGAQRPFEGSVESPYIGL
jgi:hypothetical protein